MYETRVDPLTGWAGVLREKARLTAMEVECATQYIAANPGANGEPYHEFAHLEVAAVLGMSERMARDRLEFAVALTTRLPRTLAALRAVRSMSIGLGGSPRPRPCCRMSWRWRWRPRWWTGSGN